MQRADRILLISDLHLEEARDDLTRAFLDFLGREGPGARALYILGDLFNVWIGDDDDRPLYAVVTQALKQQAGQGLAIYLLHGNRDFLLGKRFAAEAGATLLHEPHVLHHQGKHYLLLHGDVLCTRDTGYLQFRNLVRDPQWQHQFLAKPLAERRAFAEQARAQSNSMNSNKAADIMDVTPQEVLKMLDERNLDVMIHGHTHRPAVHELGGNRRRIVLGDWGSKVWFCRVEDTASLCSADILPGTH